MMTWLLTLNRALQAEAQEAAPMEEEEEDEFAGME